jgi:hypothetical protein
MAEQSGVAPTVRWARLPSRFDPERLQADLEKVLPGEWLSHYNQADYAGDWSGVALRSVSGSAAELFASPAATAFRDTPLLERCTYFRDVLSYFECPLKAVRILRLRAGSRILEHTDADIRYEDGELRIHVPIQTNPDVEFVVAGKRLILEEGSTWYIDFSLPHRIFNRGATDRVHLVIDARVNDWVHAAISAAEQPEGLEAPPDSDFDAFRELVCDDPKLQARLMDVGQPQSLFELAATIGNERGYTFTADDVRSVFRASKRAWIERWVHM